jgi:phage anti-repressor protein
MQLLTIQEHKDLKQAVSARELYDVLQPTERFASWFDRQLQYGFVETQDYLGCEVFNALARQTLADFYVSIDMAKEISMIQRSDKGRQARQYFIECERQLLEANANSPVIPQSFADALQLAANQARQLELAKPKVLHYDNVVERAGLLNATQVAQKIRLSAVAMNKVLDELGVYNKAVKRSRVFQQWFIDKGLGEVKQTDQGFSQALFTKRGEAWVIERLVSEGVA